MFDARTKVRGYLMSGWFGRFAPIVRRLPRPSFEEGRTLPTLCGGCGYDLRGLTAEGPAWCPECGRALAEAGLVAPFEPRARDLAGSLAIWGLAAMLAATVPFVTLGLARAGWLGYAPWFVVMWGTAAAFEVRRWRDERRADRRVYYQSRASFGDVPR